MTVPKILRRRFSRLASLLELADDEFIGIRDSLANYKDEVRVKVENAPNELELDAVTLDVFYRNNTEYLDMVASTNSRLSGHSSLG